jgi:curved DNA-binding protein CbpA
MDNKKAKEYINIDGEVNIESLTKAYKKAIFKHHPDHGGTSEAFIELKNAYEYLMKELKYPSKKYSSDSKQVEDIMANYSQELINKIMELIEKFATNDDININIIGDWIWLDGETKPHKEEIKSLGFKFSKNKVAWYWHNGNYRRFGGKKEYSMDEIAYRHGGMFQVSKKRNQRLQTLQPVMA